MQLRAIHTYIGMVIAPALLFFALTGLLQIYSLHEAHPGYSPPPLIEKLGMVHKNQRFTLGKHQAPGPEAPNAAATDSTAANLQPSQGEPRGPKPALALLKAFFAFVSVGLVVSTLIGVWMGLRPGPSRRTYLALLAIGVLAPTILAALSV